MTITDIPLEQRYYGNAERTMGREVREGKFEGATQYWCHMKGRWLGARSVCLCKSHHCGQFWSRPIGVGPEWELVGLGDLIQKGDQYIDLGGNWCESGEYGSRVSESSASTTLNVFAYRRRKKAENTECGNSDEWISVKERLPNKGDDIWIAWIDGAVYIHRNADLNGRNPNVTHWMPATVPKPPAPPPTAAPAKTGAEAALEQYQKEHLLEGLESSTQTQSFLAGYAAGKEAK